MMAYYRGEMGGEGTGKGRQLEKGNNEASNSNNKNSKNKDNKKS